MLSPSFISFAKPGGKRHEMFRCLPYVTRFQLSSQNVLPREFFVYVRKVYSAQI